MARLTIGTKVRVKKGIVDEITGVDFSGMIGTVTSHPMNMEDEVLFIDFDGEDFHGHSGGGILLDSTGWFMNANALVKIKGGK